MNRFILVIIVTAFMASASGCATTHKSTTETGDDRRNSSIEPYHPIKCSGKDYTYTGMYISNKGNDFHEVEILKQTNSQPFEHTILQKSDKVLIVDNQRFKIINNSENDLMAVYHDTKNIITVVINHKYGTLLYNKIFTYSFMGHQNSRSYIAECVNYSDS